MYESRFVTPVASTTQLFVFCVNIFKVYFALLYNCPFPAWLTYRRSLFVISACAQYPTWLPTTVVARVEVFAECTTAMSAFGEVLCVITAGRDNVVFDAVGPG